MSSPLYRLLQTWGFSLSLPCAKLSGVLPFSLAGRGVLWLASGRDHLITVFWVYSVKWEGSNFSCLIPFCLFCLILSWYPSGVHALCLRVEIMHIVFFCGIHSSNSRARFCTRLSAGPSVCPSEGTVKDVFWKMCWSYSFNRSAVCGFCALELTPSIHKRM